MSNTTPITMRELLEAGVHFGHQTSRWNPKMKPYIFGARNGIYIIDLQKTVGLAKEAVTFVSQITAKGKKVLFVGTKAQSKDVVKEEAIRSNSPYINERWLGGTLTNFQTMQGCLETMIKVEEKKASGLFDQLSKKEQSATEKEYQRLLRNLGGIRSMKDRPGAIFIVDPVKEHNAVAEAKKLNIPIIAITDTNCDPDDISFVIPGNDDALKSIKLFATAIANAALEGSKIYEERTRAISDKKDDEAPVQAAQAPEAEEAAPETGNKVISTTDRDGRTVDIEVRRKISKTTTETKED